jgi:dihydroorotase
MAAERRFDLLLRHCRLLDGDGLADVAVRDGRVAAIGNSPGRARCEVDCEGAFVTPAWVDSHVHIASTATPGRVDARRHGPAQGVGALIDAGSAAPARIGEVLAAGPWVFALANIDSRGMRPAEGVGPELSGRAADAALAAHPGRVVGIKVQASASVLGEAALEAIDNAIAVAERHGVPVMAHVGNPPPALADVCERLRAGDLITHYAHGKPEGATLADGSVLPALRRAVERGVLLDLGHGSSSFSYRRCRRLLEAGLAPAVISTDLHARSAVSPVVSLARTMSKLLALGMPLAEVVRAVTATPARAFGLGGYGEMGVGGSARLTVFHVDDVRVECPDSTGEALACDRWLRPLGCLLDGDWREASTPP